MRAVEGMERERELFQSLVSGEQSKALRHVFFGEREAQRVPGVPADTQPLPVERFRSLSQLRSSFGVGEFP